MKLAIGYVLYNPTEGQLKKICAVAKSGIFDYVYVHDNSPVSHAACFGENIQYDSNLQNEGLPKAYNAFIRLSADKNCSFLCLMDQDSDFPEEEMIKLKNYLSSADISGCALVAPRSYPSPETERLPREDKLTDSKFAINSGSFLNLEELSAHNLFYDENIFLDGVDYEFALAAKKEGLRIVTYEDSVLVQRLGTGRKSKGFSCHSAERYFTIVKARTYTLKKYKGRVVGGAIAIAKTFGTSLKILAYETEKLKKIKNCFKGLLAGKYKKAK